MTNNRGPAGSTIVWFGRHKGKPFRDVPYDYRLWAVYSDAAKGNRWYHNFARLHRKFHDEQRPTLSVDFRPRNLICRWSYPYSLDVIYRCQRRSARIERKLKRKKRQNDYWEFIDRKEQWEKWRVERCRPRSSRRRRKSDVIRDLGERTRRGDNKKDAEYDLEDGFIDNSGLPDHNRRGSHGHTNGDRGGSRARRHGNDDDSHATNLSSDMEDDSDCDWDSTHVDEDGSNDDSASDLSTLDDEESLMDEYDEGTLGLSDDEDGLADESSEWDSEDQECLDGYGGTVKDDVGEIAPTYDEDDCYVNCNGGMLLRSGNLVGQRKPTPGLSEDLSLSTETSAPVTSPSGFILYKSSSKRSSKTTFSDEEGREHSPPVAKKRVFRKIHDQPQEDGTCDGDSSEDDTPLPMLARQQRARKLSIARKRRMSQNPQYTLRFLVTQ